MGAVFGVRSWYSKEAGGLLSPKEAVLAAKEAGATSIAFCDLHEFGGVHEWLTQARDAGLSAMCGVEVLLDWDNAQLPALFFGRGPDGARRISELLSRANVNAEEQLMVAPAKGCFNELMVCTGGAGGHFHRLAGRRDVDNLERFFSMIGETGARILIGVDPANDDPYHLATVKRFSKFAAIPYRPLVYRSKADYPLYSDVSRVISDGPAEPWVNDFTIQTMQSMAEQAKAIGGYPFDQRWMSVLGKAEGSVGKGFSVVENPGELFLNGHHSPSDAFGELMHRCATSLNSMTQALAPGEKERYAQRLNFEGEAIQKLNMAGYLLALSDVVEKIRAAHPVGRGRGSSINCLVCRLLDITKIDPVAEDLPFERFLNVNRRELPDVDIDVSRKAAPGIRSRIRELFSEAYGLRTFITPSVRSFLPRVMVARGLKSGAIESFQRDLREYSAPEARTWEEIVQSWPQAREALSLRCGSTESADGVLELMVQVGYERPVRSTVHESGIAVCAKPFQEIVALQPCLKNDETELCVACPAGTAEERGIVKIDVLPLDSLDQLNSINRRLAKLETAPVFADRGREFGEVHGKAILDRGFTGGIFQFERQGDLLAGLQIRSVEDLTFAAGLVRVIGPGGAMPEKPASLGDAPQALRMVYDQVTSKTRGLLVFQEQLMKILVQTSGMGFEDGEKVRRAIAKKTGECDAYRSQFAEGCANLFGVNKSFGELFFDEITRGGKYLFNQGHARSYAEIAAAQIVAKTENTTETFVEMSRSLRLQTYRRRDEFPITVAIKLFNWLESDVMMSESLSRPELNAGQNECLTMFAQNIVTTIHGPPGTGKSTTNAALIEHGATENKKILCCSTAHTAIDAIAEKLVDLHDAGGSPILTELFNEKRVTRYGVSTIRNKIRDILYSTKAAFTDPRTSLEDDMVSICTNYRVLGLEKIELFDYVMVDEAGTVNLPYLYCVACLSTEKVVVCGDPNQLKPVFSYNRSSVLTRALFERHIYRHNKVRLDVNDEPDRRIATLYEQHRMPDELAELVRLTGLYRRYETSPSYRGPSGVDRTALECAPLGGHALVVLDTSHIGARYTTRANLQHQEVIKALVSHYLSTSHQMHIGVISPYRPQAEAIRKWLREHKVKKVTAGTVHQFQGSEFPLVIWDTVESPSSTAKVPSHFFTDDVKYLDTLNLLNVAVSRARGKLVILANVDYLLNHLSQGCYLHTVLDYAGKLHRIVPAAVALRRMGIELGQAEAVASYFPRDPAYVNCKEITFEEMFMNDATAARGDIAIFNRAADIACLYELMGFLDPLAARHLVSVSIYLPRNVSKDVRNLVQDAYRTKNHFQFPHPRKWTYSHSAFAVFDNRLSYLIDPDLNPPSLANGEVPVGFTRYIS